MLSYSITLLENVMHLPLVWCCPNARVHAVQCNNYFCTDRFTYQSTIDDIGGGHFKRDHFFEHYPGHRNRKYKYST